MAVLFYDGLPVPFYITSIQPKGPRKAVVRLEDIDTLADAEEAAGKDIRLDPADYPELSGTDAHTITEDGLTLEDLIGFSLQDQDGRRAGTIGDIQYFSGNICLESPSTTTSSSTSISKKRPSPCPSVKVCCNPIRVSWKYRYSEKYAPTALSLPP